MHALDIDKSDLEKAARENGTYREMTDDLPVDHHSTVFRLCREHEIPYPSKT